MGPKSETVPRRWFIRPGTDGTTAPNRTGSRKRQAKSEREPVRLPSNRRGSRGESQHRRGRTRSTHWPDCSALAPGRTLSRTNLTRGLPNWTAQRGPTNPRGTSPGADRNRNRRHGLIRTRRRKHPERRRLRWTSFPTARRVNRLGVKWFETRSVSSSAHGACAVRRFVGLRPTRITELFDFRTTPGHFPRTLYSNA